MILTSQLVQQRRGDGNVRLGEAGHLAGPRVHRLPPAQDERLLLPRAHEAAQLLREFFPFWRGREPQWISGRLQDTDYRTTQP